MREGQLLDGFPLHLLTGAEPGAVIAVLDSDALGRLQLAPGFESAMAEGSEASVSKGFAVALARGEAILRRTRDGWDANRGRCPWLVRADPERPPFRRDSVDGVLCAGELPQNWQEPLSARAWTASVESVASGSGGVDPSGGWPDGAGQRAAGAALEYFVRPACDREYFATRSWAAPDWPFDVLQLGRFRQVRLAANRWAGRTGITRLYDGARICIERKGANAPVEPTAANSPVEELFGAGQGFGLFAKVAWNALLLGVENGRRIVKFPLNDVASARMNEQAEHLSQLFEGDDPLAAYVPRVTEHSSIGNQEYWTETMCPGVPATQVPLLPRADGWGMPWKRRAAREGVEFLIALHTETAEVTRVSEDLFEQFTKSRFEAITRAARRLEPGFDLTPLAASLFDALVNREIPLVQTHGDYWPGNVLVTRQAKLAAVLDWDASQKRGWPLLDLFHFIAFQHKRRAFWHFGSTLSKRLEPRKLPTWELDLANAYCQRLAIPSNLWTPFVALYWIERVSQWLITDFHDGKRNDPWLRRNVLRTAPALLKALAAIR